MSMAADKGFNPQHRNATRISGKWVMPSASDRLQSGTGRVEIQPYLEGMAILDLRLPV
jgi:hypothetical protein